MQTTTPKTVPNSKKLSYQALIISHMIQKHNGFLIYGVIIFWSYVRGHILHFRKLKYWVKVDVTSNDDKRLNIILKHLNRDFCVYDKCWKASSGVLLIILQPTKEEENERK